MGAQKETQARDALITNDVLRAVIPLTRKTAAKALGMRADRYLLLCRGRVLYDQQCGQAKIWGISDAELQTVIDLREGASNSAKRLGIH